MTPTQPKAATESGYYTVSQAAARLGVSRISIWRWVRDGYLPATRLGPRTTRIKREVVDRVLMQIQAVGSRSWALHGGAPELAGDNPSPWAPLVSTGSHTSAHTVQFYENDAALVDVVVDYIAAGLIAGDAAIVLATKSHRRAMEARLREWGIDLDRAIASGRYSASDAAETLARFMVAGTPDAERYAETVRAIHASLDPSRPVRQFGEMAPLLNAQGNSAAAICLEHLGNDLPRQIPLSRLCAYHLEDFGADAGGALGDVCAAHDLVIPATSYTQLQAERDRSQAVVALQQKVHWLEAQLDERRRVADGLRYALAAEQDAHREAIAAQRKRDEIFSVAAQELKHPLYSLSLQAQQALVRLSHELPLEQAEVERAVDAAVSQPAELPHLIAQLVDFSKAQSRKLSPQPRWTDLSALVESVLTDMRVRRGVSAITFSGPASVEVWIDPERIGHVVESLIDNAIKYSPPGDPIEIALSAPQNGSMELSVRDRGTGVAPEKRGELFERSDDLPAPGSSAGLKLGLYVSRQIVELHGGELFAEFPSDGGSRLIMRLPIGGDESTVRIAAD